MTDPRSDGFKIPDSQCIFFGEMYSVQEASKRWRVEKV